VRHDRHPRLDDRATMAFVREAPGSPTQQARNDAFDPQWAMPTGVGQVHLGRGPDVVQVRLVQHSGDILRCWRRGEGSDGFRDPHGENPPRMQRVTQGRVIERQITRERVDGRGGACPDASDCLLHLVDQGSTSLASLGLPTGRCQAKMKPAAGSAIMPGLRPNWAGQLLLPLQMGAMVGSYALTILQWGNDLPCVSRREWSLFRGGYL
jgi:hypothetical protein